MTQNYPILPYKMLVNPKEITVINLFYNLPHFLFNLPNFSWASPYGLSNLNKKKLKNAIYDKEFLPRRESNRGRPVW